MCDKEQWRQKCVSVCVVYRRAGRTQDVHRRVDNMPVFRVSQCYVCLRYVLLFDGGGRRYNKQRDANVNGEWERWVKLVKDTRRKKRKSKEQCCLRFKATSQLACGHSTCGELPKHHTTRQPPLSSMQPTPTHRHYQTTTHHLFYRSHLHQISILVQCVAGTDVWVCVLLVWPKTMKLHHRHVAH